MESLITIYMCTLMVFWTPGNSRLASLCKVRAPINIARGYLRSVKRDFRRTHLSKSWKAAIKGQSYRKWWWTIIIFQRFRRILRALRCWFETMGRQRLRTRMLRRWNPDRIRIKETNKSNYWFWIKGTLRSGNWIPKNSVKAPAGTKLALLLLLRRKNLTLAYRGSQRWRAKPVPRLSAAWSKIKLTVSRIFTTKPPLAATAIKFYKECQAKVSKCQITIWINKVNSTTAETARWVGWA